MIYPVALDVQTDVTTKIGFSTDWTDLKIL